MLTSKERAELRAKTHDLDLIITVGKGGITDNLIRETDLALTARELIKCQVLETALMSARAAVWVSEKQQASAMMTSPGRERGKRYNTVHRSRKEDCRHPQHKRKKSD